MTTTGTARAGASTSTSATATTGTAQTSATTSAGPTSTAGAGAPGAMSPDTVAVAAGKPITHAALVHWMAVDARSQSQAGQPVIVPSDPPAFNACVAQVRREVPSLKGKTATALRADCAQLFRALSSQVMDFLIKADWYQADAARLKITPSSSEVNRTFNADKAKTFPTASGFHAYLAKSGETVTDVRFRVLVSEIFTRLVGRKTGSQTAREKAVDSEAKKLFQPSTYCTAQVAIADCGRNRG